MGSIILNFGLASDTGLVNTFYKQLKYLITIKSENNMTLDKLFYG